MIGLPAFKLLSSKNLNQTCTLAAGLGLLCALLLVGCHDDAPVIDTGLDDGGGFDGSIDPGSGSIALTSTTVPGPDGAPVELALIGRNLRTEPSPGGSGEVDILIDVSVQNRGGVALFPPAELAVVRLENRIRMPDADWTACPRCLPEAQCSCVYGFSYADRLGQDAILVPGEESAPRTWRFRMEQLASFSFAAEARFGVDAGRPHLAGVIFTDLDEDGRRDPDEFPFGGGTVQVTGPGVDGVVVTVREDGTWYLPVNHVGLYTLLATPPPTFAPVHFTTPNPLEVVLTPGPAGPPASYDEAHFGVANDIPGRPPAVRLVADASGLEQDHYLFSRGGIDGGVLTLQVGYSGCQADHPFALFMVGGFMESYPVQARLILSHDDRGEACDAAFSKLLAYDLSPIREAYIRGYGGPGPVILNLETPDGSVHTFRLEPSPIDSTGGTRARGG